MMNGKKFGNPKIPLFMQKKQVDKKEEIVEVEKEAERYNETVIC